MHPIKVPKKLIEVALPLDAINEAAAREKSIRHGHPSTLHLWWARRPLAAARAVIFAQMVNDPGYQQGGGFRYGVNKEKATLERERLFKIIEDLVQWENTNNEEVLERARAEMRRSWRETCELNKNHPQAAELFNPEKLPGFHDPFAGGGAIPLEAQRLGLESHSSDLNPVAVTINKAMIEIPPRFAGRTPVGPLLRGEKQTKLHEDWSGARGLAEDVRRYSAWMRVEAEKRIGGIYPAVEVTADMAAERADLRPLIGQRLTVIAWLWARTVKSPNPAFSDVEVPLASSFVLSSKEGKEAYIQPVIEGNGYRFLVKIGKPPEGAKSGTAAGKRGGFYCLLSTSPIDYKYIRSEGQAGRIGKRLMAIVAEGPRGRVYISPTQLHEDVARSATPEWKPDVQLHGKCRVNVANYGLVAYGDLFTARQLVALNALTDLVTEAVDQCRRDAVEAGLPDDLVPLDQGGSGALAYAQAIGVYLGFAISKLIDINNALAPWGHLQECPLHLFARQAIPMAWDFAEANPLCESSGSWMVVGRGVDRGLEPTVVNAHLRPAGFGHLLDATKQTLSAGKVVSTDPPYYDNISYADLSDFFYVWLRRSLKPIFPSLYATLAVPKAEELVATPYRHGSQEAAEAYFLEGMTHAIRNLAKEAHPAFPVTIYYAFKQSETQSDSGTTSTGWETFLEAVIGAGFGITGTWPIRTERTARAVGQGANALASSIVLVCRKRATDAPTVSRREFIRELNAALPEALDEMTRGGVNSPVAPVDLSQAIIGPGMAIFSQYAAVLEADGTPMRVKAALQLINRFLAEDDFDHDTQFCLHWFEQQGWGTGVYGEAEVLARAKGTALDALAHAGVVESSKGSVRLLKWAEMSRHWSPETDARTPVWEALHQLIRSLNQEGESAAGSLLARMPARAEPIRALAYRLYTLCERKNWVDDARAYNELVNAWGSIEQEAGEAGVVGTQSRLDI